MRPAATLSTVPRFIAARAPLSLRCPPSQVRVFEVGVLVFGAARLDFMFSAIFGL
jgi:hypothetical protein